MSSARGRWIKAGLYAGTAVAIGVATKKGAGREIDDKAFHALNGSHDPVRDAVFGGVTELGSIWASVAGGAVIAASGRRRAAASAVAAAAAAWVLGQAMKKGYNRPRPYDMHPETARRVIGKPSGTSWPSSHPAVFLAFLTTVGRGLDLPPAARAASLGLAGSVAVSRTYLGVHFPSDILSGLLLGRAIGLIWPIPEQAEGNRWF